MPLAVLVLLAGGIVANNASGMCCGVAQNTYHTIADMRLLLADGIVLDTADENSRKAFLQVRQGHAAAVASGYTRS
jgi:D-lactate dehydrogenase